MSPRKTGADMPTKALVDASTGQVTYVPLTTDEYAQWQVDQAAGAAAAASEAMVATNSASMTNAITSKLDQLVGAADAIAAGNATAAQQRDALVLALRSVARLARLALGQTDKAV
jgi:hypothetical protein